MKKSTAFLSLIVIITTLSFISCRKKDLNVFNKGISSSDAAIVPDGKSPAYVEQQLKWIARALPLMARNNSTFKYNLHQLLFLDINLKKHNSASQISLASTPINFTNTVKSTVSALYPGTNNYDSGYFFSFTYEDCVNRTLIRLNHESKNNYSTKMLVSCTQYEGIADTITGYYWDTVNNRLDSLNLFEDNASDYYVWIVEADNDCLEDLGATTASFKFNPEGHCGNGKCEPFLKESYANNQPYSGYSYCSDCQDIRDLGKYTLVLKEFQHLMDRHVKSSGIDDTRDLHDYGYHETYFSGKYDIFFNYAIVQSCETSPTYTPGFVKDAWYINSIVKRTFRDWYEDNNGNETKKWTDLILARLNVGKGDVVREFWSNSRHVTTNGSSAGNTIITDRVLSYNFIPSTDRIYIDMLEWDQGRPQSEDIMDISSPCVADESWWFPHYRQKDHKQGGIGSQESQLDDFTDNLPYYWGFLHGTYYPGPTPYTNDFWLDGSSLYGSGTKYIDLVKNDNTGSSDPDFLGFAVGANSVPWYPKKSEMRIRLVMYPN